MNKKQVTIKEFAEMVDVDYIVASSVMKFLEKVAAAVPIGNRSVEGKRGKPSIVYELDQEVVLEFWQNENSPAVETLSQAAVIEIPEVKAAETPVETPAE